MPKNLENTDFERDLLTQLGETEDHNQQDDQELDENDQELEDKSNDKSQQKLDDDDNRDDQESDEDKISRELNARGDEQDQQRQRRQKDEQQEQQQQQQDGQVTDPFDLRARFEDRNGSLFLNGKLVAKAGRDRKVFEGFRKMAQKDRSDSKKMAQRLIQIAEGAKELYAKYTAETERKTLFDKAGLSVDDQMLMLQIGQEYKKNPLAGIKLFLTKAQMAGVDVKSLGIAGNSFDPSVIVNDLTKAIDDRLKPITERTARDADTDKVRKEAQGFFDRNPEAEVFADSLKGGAKELASILKKAKELSPEKTLDELWEMLHYKLLLNGQSFSTTTVVANKDRRENNNSRRQTRNNKRRGYTGEESFDNIGQDVLDDIARITAQG